jgi:DNA-binding NarL/FixJ family response regulator
MKILIADDHALLRQGLRLILVESGRSVEIGEASNGGELLAQLSCPWDVLILDISFPDATGLELLREVKAVRPALPVLVLSMHAEQQYAVRALRNGAAGYLTKESAPDELLRAIDKVAMGGKYVTAGVAEALASEIAGDLAERTHQLLSDREYEVLCLIARGKRPAEIAAQLKVSTKTVSTYRSRILEKMGFSNNAEIVRYAIQHKLV